MKKFFFKVNQIFYYYYNNGWFNGTIKYFNSVLNEYVITYEDDSIDYVLDTDFYGIELSFVS